MAAMTASVWGKGKQAMTKVRPLRDGEEECFVCRNDMPAIVRLVGCPCNGRSAVCLACVENMRASNIFKANKGVTCPFCRGFIEGYELMDKNDPAAPQLEALLSEANRAARVAAAARTGTTTSLKPELASGSSLINRADWACRSCKTNNAWWAPKCFECDHPGPNPAPTQPAGMHPTEDVRQMILTLHHPLMEKAFGEINVPITPDNKVGQYSERQMMATLKAHGAARLFKMAGQLSDPAFLRECSTHINGNFTVQNLIEVIARIRKLLSTLQPQAAQQYFAVEKFKRAFRGLDPFGLLLYTMLPMASELAVHTQGTYVCQKLINFVNNEQELYDICRAVLPDIVVLLNDDKGKFAVVRTVDGLQELLEARPAQRPIVAKGINFAAKAFLQQFNKAMFAAGNYFGCKLVAAIVTMGIPCFEALDLGSRLATHSRNLLGRGIHGHNTVSTIINARGGPGCMEFYCEHMRDLVCIITMQLLDSVPELVMSQDPKDIKLVKDLVIRLAEEQEVLWIEEIIGVLVNRGDDVAKYPPALAVLVTALSVDLLTDDDVHLHLLQLRQLVGNDVYSIADQVEAVRGPDLQMPPLRYAMPSAIQPDLRMWLLAGNKLPPPPPPPPHYLKRPTNLTPASSTPTQPPPPPQTQPPPTTRTASPPAPPTQTTTTTTNPAPTPTPSRPLAPPVPTPAPPAAPPPPTPVPRPAPTRPTLPPGFAIPTPISMPTPTPPMPPHPTFPQPHPHIPPPYPTPHPTLAPLGSQPWAPPTAAPPPGFAPRTPTLPTSTPINQQPLKVAAIPVVRPAPPPPPPVASLSPAFQQLALGASQPPSHLPTMPTAPHGPNTPSPPSSAPAPPPAKFLPYAVPVNGAAAPPASTGTRPPFPANTPASSTASAAMPTAGRFAAAPAPAAAPAQAPQFSTPTLSNGAAAPPAHPASYAAGMCSAPVPPPPPPAASAEPWECKVCTYVHEGTESEFLSCALCGTLKEH